MLRELPGLSERLSVRTTPSLFEDLDRQLGRERGPNGEPSVTDFQVHEMLAIVERFAVGFQELPELFAGRPDYRVLISTGVLVRGFSVIGQLAPDGAVELVGLEVDLGAG